MFTRPGTLGQELVNWVSSAVLLWAMSADGDAEKSGSALSSASPEEVGLSPFSRTAKGVER